MNSFGLGLVLGFTDNASSGMRRVSQTFNELNGLADQLVSSSDSAMYSVQSLASAGLGLTMVGDQFAQAGETITSVFSGLISKVTEVGTTVMGQKMTLNTLFKSAEEGEKAFQWVKEFAKASIFNFEDLLPAMTIMKSVGIDVRDEIKSTSGATQNLLEYAGDLAAVFPQMTNSYGTGVNAAMGALKEYIAEGNALTLKRGAGLDIAQILGEDKGKSIEERSRQVADLIDKMGILGMTAELAGTPMQRLGNVEDTWFNMLTEIADSGVFQKYSDFIEKFTDYIFAIPDEELSNIAQIIADSLVAIMSPLETLLDVGIAIADWVRTLIKEHPGITKLLITTTAFVGVLLVGAGYALKFAGSIFLLTSALTQMRVLAQGGTSILRIFGNATSMLFTKALPFVALAGLMYIAWQKNLFGIKDLVTGVFKELATILAITFDAFADNTLTEDMWLKARDLGILPFVEAILLLKYHWGFFVEGFKAGFNSIFDSLNEWGSKFAPLKLSVYDFANKLADVIGKITGVDMTDGWESVGSVLGKIVGILTVAIPLIKIATFSFGVIMKVVGGVTSIVKSVIGIGATIGAIVAKIVSFADTLAIMALYVGDFFVKVGGIVSGVLTTVAGVLGISVGWLVAIIVGITALVIVIVKYREQIKDFFVNLGQGIADLFNSLKDKVSGWWNSIVTTITQSVLFQTIKTIFESVANVVIAFISGAIEVFKSMFNVIKTIVMGVVSVFVEVFNIVKAVVTGAIDIIVSIFNFMYEVVRVIVYAVMYVFQEVFNFINDNIIQPFVGFVTDKFNWLKDNVFAPIGEFFMTLWQTAVDFVTPLIEGIGNVFSVVSENIIAVFTGVKDFFVGVFDSISETAGAFFDWIAGKLSVVTDAIGSVSSFFSGGIDKASNWVGGVGNKLKGMVGLSTGGYVKSTGVAMLHPNEVVVNSDLTKTLGLFLDDYKDERSNSPKPVEISPTSTNTSTSKGNDPVAPITVIKRQGDTNTEVPTTVQNDYSVTFGAGSVVIQLANATEAELEKAAEKLMKIIERKQQLKKMALRTS